MKSNEAKLSVSLAATEQGKTTLLKVLSRITEPTEGLAEIHGRVSSLLEVGTGFHPELTGRENIYLNGAILGMKRAEINHKFDEIVAFAEIEKFIDTPVKRHYPARYMLLVLAWNGDAGNLLPAVNHLETGRLQTMRREWNPRYYRLVEKFGEATGVPVLMNTSFNLRGEPIVGSPANAWNTFSKSGIDVLVLGRHVVRK